MADTLNVQFIGGPCNGKTKPVPKSYVDAGDFLCSGAHYQVQAGTANPVFARYYVPSVGFGGQGASAIKAYNDLNRAVGGTLPNDLNRAAKLTRAALKRIPSRAKVGGRG